MSAPRVSDLMQGERPRYFFHDPARFGCLCAVAALVFLPRVPFVITMLSVCVIQGTTVMIALQAMGRGWSMVRGARVRESVLTSHFVTDYLTLLACIALGALLLVRHFNGTEVVAPLGILAATLCLLPDVRLFRWLAGGDPAEATRRLRHGYLVADPALWAAMLAAAVVCLLDPISLRFMLLSLGILAVHPLLLFVDKYFFEIEARRFRGLAALFLERDGRRLVLALAALGIIPLRAQLGDGPAIWGAAAIVASVLVPDAVRLVWAGLRALGALFRVAPARPSTLVVLPK